MTYFVESDNALKAEFKFVDFTQAWAFMSEVAIHDRKLAEKINQLYGRYAK